MKKKIIIGLGIFLAIVVGFAAWVYFGSSGAADRATEFVNAIKNGDSQTAYNQFMDELKEVQSYEEFTYQISTLNLDSSCNLEISGREVASGSGGSYQKVSGKVKCSDKEYPNTNFEYKEVGDELKLYGYQINP